MSEENVAIVARMYEKARTRPEALFEFLDEDIEWDTTALEMAGTAQGRGPETVRSFFRSWVGAFEEWDFEAEELIDAGDAVIALIHQWGRGKASRVTVENRFWQVWTMQEGRAIRATHHAKRAEALEAAGLADRRMSEENVEIVRSIYEGWSQGNMNAGVELFDPGIVFESYMPDASERVVAHGHEGVAAFMGEFLKQMSDYRLFADEIRAVGEDAVFVVGRQAATGRRSGAAVEGPTCSVWKFRDGKVVSLLFDTDGQAALEAAGMSE